MKIAVVHNLPAGGMKRALYEQVKRLSYRHTIDVYTLSCADETFLPLKEFCHRYTIFRHGPPAHFPASVLSIYFKLPKVYREMAEVINRGEYDAAFVNPCFLTQSPYILSYLTIPTLYQCPEPKREFYENMPRVNKKWTYMATLPFRLPIKVIDAANTRHASKIVVHSNYSKRKIDEIYGIDTEVLPLGVDTQKFTLRLARDDRVNFVLSVGDLSLHKGYDFLIRSIGLIPEQLRPQLVAVGHGGYEKDYFMKLAQERKVSLILKENISDDELVKLYNSTQAFVYAARKEPFGLVVLEAAACGLQILAVGEGGVKEIMTDPIMGVTVPRVENVFAQELMRLMDKRETEKEKSERRKYVQDKWDWDKSVKMLERYLSEVIKN